MSRKQILFLIFLLILSSAISIYASKEFRINNIRFILMRDVLVYHQVYGADVPKFDIDERIKGYVVVLPLHSGDSYYSPYSNFSFPTEDIKVWKTEDIKAWCRENISEDSIWKVYRGPCVIENLYPAEYTTFPYHIYKQEVMLLYWHHGNPIPEKKEIYWDDTFPEIPSNPRYIISAEEAYVVDLDFVMKVYSLGMGRYFGAENQKMDKISGTKTISVSKINGVTFCDTEEKKEIAVSSNNIYRVIYEYLFIGRLGHEFISPSNLSKLLSFMFTSFIIFFILRSINDLAED